MEQPAAAVCRLQVSGSICTGLHSQDSCSQVFLRKAAKGLLRRCWMYQESGQVSGVLSCPKQCFEPLAGTRTCQS